MNLDLVFTIPAKWPPAHPEELISGIKEGTKLRNASKRSRQETYPDHG